MLKVVITALLIVVIAEISKRSSFIAALLASLPLISLLAIIWLYEETKDVQKVSDLAVGVFWLVIPSLVLFISLPVLLKYQVNFYLSLLFSIILTIGAYGLMLLVLGRFGIKL